VIRVLLPAHLSTLAQVGREVELEVAAPVTTERVLDALEDDYPMLRGTIRDQRTKERRPYIRYFACEADLSHDAPESPLPDRVANGVEPFVVLGAMAGG
jgi:molybdopterin synthase sulfur carrier subunit